MKIRDLMYFGLIVTALVTVTFTAFNSIIEANSNSLSTEFKNTSFYNNFVVRYGNNITNTGQEGEYYSGVKNLSSQSEERLKGNQSLVQGGSEWQLLYSGFSVVTTMGRLPYMLKDFAEASTTTLQETLPEGAANILSVLLGLVGTAVIIFFIFELIQVLTGRNV